MIVKWLIEHQIKETIRSSFWQKQIILNIVMGLMLMIMLAYLVMLGLFIDKLFEQLAPDEDPVQLFNGFVLYYLSVEFILRLVMQSLPVLNIETYLTLPLRKSSIAHYVAAKSIFNVGNFLSWLVFIPFAIKVIAPGHSAGSALVWVIGMILLVLTNNFLAGFAKRQLVHKPWITALFVIFLAFAMGGDALHLYSLSSLSRGLLNGMLESPLMLLIPVAALVIGYGINYGFLRNRLYPDEINRSRKAATGSTAELRYLKTLGLTGHLISLDLRMMLRNKRTKSTIYMTPIFLLYGLLLYPDIKPDEISGMLVFIGIFMTGGLMIGYLNYCFSYESGYFDGILANYADFGQYIRAKYLLGAAMTTVFYLLTIPYVLMGTRILVANTAAFLYNVGFLSFVMIYLSTYSTKKVDLNRSASFNYQGMGASQWLSMLPGFLVPVLIYYPFKIFGLPNLGFAVIGLIGLAGLVFHKSILSLITKQFMARRYEMAKGFRE